MKDISHLFLTVDCTIRDALKTIDASVKGIALLIADDGTLQRTITDGDLRRLMLTGCHLDTTLGALDTQEPIVASSSDNTKHLLQQMNEYGINHIVIINKHHKPVDIVHRHEIDTSILLSTPHLGEEEQAFVAQAFNTNWVAPVGPNIDAFERELAEKVGVSYAVAVSSGTAAIHLALRVLGVGQGDTVFCSTFTFVASANPIVYQGATPVFIDSEWSSWNMSPQALQKALEDANEQGKLPKAVIVVNLYGQSADMDEIVALCDAYEVPVVEDAAESLGATYKGKASGTLGKIGIYSFNGNKIITTSGGGMLVTEDKELADQAKFLSTQAREPVAWYEHQVVGYNYRMSNILAGIGRGQLKVLDERVEARREVFETYRVLLSDYPQIQWMPEASFGQSTRWLTALTFIDDSVDIMEVCRIMAEENIEVRPLWKPMHLQPVFSEAKSYSHGDICVSETLFARGLCLPSGSNLKKVQLERVANVLKRFLDAHA